jgi:hypothetical protein
LRTFEMVGVDTPARCAICWSVMRFGRAFTLNLPVARQSNQMRNLTASLLPKIDILIAGKYPTTGVLTPLRQCAACACRKAYAKFSMLDMCGNMRLGPDIDGAQPRRTLRG